MGPRMCFGFLIPNDHMQSVGKLNYEKLFPDDEIEDYYHARATYKDVATAHFMAKAKELPWVTPRMAHVYATSEGHIGRVVSLFDNFTHHLGQLGTPRRPGPKQLTPEIIEQYQKAIGLDISPRWYYMYDQA